MKSLNGTKYIYRYSTGWRVYIKHDPDGMMGFDSKLFGGDMDKALEAAKSWRDWRFTQVPPLDPRNRRVSRVKKDPDLPPGICRRDCNGEFLYYIVRIRMPKEWGGKIRLKAFNVKHLGKEEAYRQAMLLREKIYKEIRMYKDQTRPHQKGDASEAR